MAHQEHSRHQPQVGDACRRWLPAVATAVAIVLLGGCAVSGRHDTAAVVRPMSSGPVSAIRSVPPSPSIRPAAVVHAPTPAQSDAAVCRQAGARHKLFRVSISQQRAWLCNRTALYLATPVTTGADTRSRRTHPGSWKIEHAWPDAWLSGADYNEHVDYWMPYDGQFGIHDASWQKFPFGSSRWRTEGSHGCVHVPHAAMKTLFRWAPIGTTVTIVR